MGSGKEARKSTGVHCGREFGHAGHAICSNKDTAKREIPVGLMLTGGHARDKKRHLGPRKSTQNKQREDKGRSIPEPGQANPKDRRANVHKTTNIVQIRRSIKAKKTTGKCRSPRKKYLNINMQTRQRKESNLNTKMARQQSRKQRKKNATKTGPLFWFNKPLQKLKQRRKNCKHKRKIFYIGKCIHNKPH